MVIVGLETKSARTGFKIGTSVGIIILLLGMAVLFGIYQMSLVSQNIIQVSEKLVPLEETISEIRHNQLIQSSSFERMISSLDENVVDKAKQDFWFSGGVIDSQITRAKKIIGVGIETPSDTNSAKSLSLKNRISNIENYHSDYEELAKSVFTQTNINSNDQSLGQILKTEEKLRFEIDYISSDISGFTESAIDSIEKSESNALFGQIIIILAVGAIASLLGFFIHQINRDLQKEVKLKTEELHNANERLKKLDEMKNEFIGIASHELKSPIQPIMGFAELAKSGDIDQNEAWDGVTQLAKKLQDLANDVLDVSKIENKQLRLNKESVKINELISDVVNSFRINAKNITLQENYDEDIEIRVDKMRFDQVMRNLLTNAIKFTQKGQIKVSTHVNIDENYVQVIVADNGDGIPNEIISRIFEKFVTKGHGSQSGTGLGLFLCKGIIEAHGGEISAKNNESGGATFEFKLPVSSKIQEKKIIQKNM
jgi:signal transduction histidine kinase